MTVIRPYAPADLEALYVIALATGDAGADASRLHDDPSLVGEIYAAPYAVLSPETAFVAEDAGGVAGYIVGALDTRAFEARLETDWWPDLRARHPDPGEDYYSLDPDGQRRWLMHHPQRTPRALAEPYPSHLHVNLLPRLQGQGVGKRLLDIWMEAVRNLGSRGAHLGVNTANARAIRFYRAYGLVEPRLAREPPAGVKWFARAF